MRAAVVALLVVFAPVAVRAEPVVEPGSPAPSSYSKLGWKSGADVHPGFWFSDEQVLKINKRIDFLENHAAKECVDAQVTAKRASIPPWIAVTVGIVLGATAGYLGAKKL